MGASDWTPYKTGADREMKEAIPSPGLRTYAVGLCCSSGTTVHAGTPKTDEGVTEPLICSLPNMVTLSLPAPLLMSLTGTVG